MEDKANIGLDMISKNKLRQQQEHKINKMMEEQMLKRLKDEESL